MRFTRPLHAIRKYPPLRRLVGQRIRSLKRRVHARRTKQYRQRAARPLVESRILVITTAGIGNAVEATPLVQAIRIHWPRAHVTVCSPPGDLLEDWCVPDIVVTSPQALQGETYDRTFVTWGCDIPKCVDSLGLGQVCCVKILFWIHFLKPEREYNMDMIRRLGYKGPTPPLYVSFREPGEAIPSSALRICLVPGGKPEQMWKHKRWPYYQQLVESLLTQYPEAQICIVGAEDDKFPDTLPRSSRIADLRGRLTLRETAWILRSASIAVGNDCGPMHIADAVQTPSVVLFGPTCELKNGPRYKGVPLSVDEPCRPCQYADPITNCLDPRCLTDISADIVMQKVSEILRSLKSSRQGLRK